MPLDASIKKTLGSLSALLDDHLAERVAARKAEEQAAEAAKKAAAEAAQNPAPKRKDVSRDRKAQVEEMALSYQSLVGSFFHRADRDNDHVELQGVIVAEPQPGWYLAELFNWQDGGTGHQRLYRLQEMEDFRFYDTAEWMNEARLENRLMDVERRQSLV